MRVVNVVKRVDGVQGSRYLLELELKDEKDGNLVRLSHYVYALIYHSRNRVRDFSFQDQKPQLVLCNPKGFRWYPDAMVNFIVPGTSSFSTAHFSPNARHTSWVHQLNILTVQNTVTTDIKTFTDACTLTKLAP